MQTSDDFPEDPPAPVRRWFRLSDLIALILLILFISALVPSIIPPHHGLGPARRTACANNLSQLYKLCNVYAANHRGKWPQAEGEDLWVFLQTCQPPLIDPTMTDILLCPLKEEEPLAGSSDYRGPERPAAKLNPGDPLGADKPGNHGHKDGGNVLRMDGSVMEHGLDDPEWLRCKSLLKP